MRILAELRQIFERVISRKIIKTDADRFEIDIYIPEIKLGIEYDGVRFHNNKAQKDKLKNQIAKKQGIILIRIREEPLEKIDQCDVLVSKEKLKKADINHLLVSIRENFEDLPGDFNKNADDYLLKPKFIANELYQSYIKNFPAPLPPA